ncbi:MAG TPA: MarR family transcriptional regulator [Gaiellaceae bacterium]|nr:MarR family transcriptional regulator [Gaiellaceae bacterium]
MSAQLSAEPALEAWIRFLRAHAAITRELSTRLETAHGLTLSDFDVLVQLYYAPSRRMRRVDIARTVLLTASGVTRLLDGLERNGLVRKERCESDARVTYAALTERGVAAFEAARHDHRSDIEELFGSNFSSGERETLAELLGRLPLAPTSPACTSDEEE